MIVLKASVIGNIASDPELRSSASGPPPLLRFTVASNGRARSADGQRRDEVAWVQVIVLGQRAERLAPALRKGQRVFADGRLEARPWIHREGEAPPRPELAPRGLPPPWRPADRAVAARLPDVRAWPTLNRLERAQAVYDIVISTITYNQELVGATVSAADLVSAVDG